MADDNKQSDDKQVRRSEMTFSYKEPEVLVKFLTRTGYIRPRSQTGLSKQQQRELAREIKRARELALVQYTQTI